MFGFWGFLVWYKAKTNLDMKNMISDELAYGQGVQGGILTETKNLWYLFNSKPAK